MPKLFNDVDENHPYYDLVKVFYDAFYQASAGKGSERHAYSSDESYSKQVLCEMDRRLGGKAIGPRYQAVKKIYESARMDKSAAIKEILGAINYLAAAVIVLEEKESSPQKENSIHNLIDDKFGLSAKVPAAGFGRSES